MAALAPSSVRFYLHGERRLQDDLRLWVGAHLDGVALASVDGQGRDTVIASLPPRACRLVGFTDEESLIPYPRTVYPGFRLLQEYFTLPQKFAFFEVTGLEALASEKVADRFAILLSFKDGLPQGCPSSPRALSLAMEMCEQEVNHLIDRKSVV